jgi:hypothetical protein
MMKTIYRTGGGFPKSIFREQCRVPLLRGDSFICHRTFSAKDKVIRTEIEV